MLGWEGVGPGWRRMLAGLMLLLGIGLVGGQAVGGGSVYAGGGYSGSALGPMDTPSPTPICNLSWQTVTSPNPSATTNYLDDVVAVSANDVWAVGSYNLSTGGIWTLILHWDGDQWTHIPSPNPDPNANSGYNVLIDVEAISTSDVWAVGYARAPSAELTLVEHWDGSQWSVVPSPNPNPRSNHLNGVSAISGNDIWAVGYYTTANNSAYQTLVEHWNGTQWTIVPSPNVGTESNGLNAVSALSTNDIWVAGSYGYDLTLVEHWDGAQWSVVPTTDPVGAYNNWLNAVVAIASNDVWFVGSYQTQTGASSTLIDHWNGTQMSTIPSPNLGPSIQDLFDIAAISPSDIWAVGYYCCNSGGPSLNLAMHWDGVQWSIVSTPNPGVYNNSLEGVAAISSGDVWAAGYIQSCPGGSCPWTTLTEHYTLPSQCQPTPTLTPTSIPTSTSTTTPTATITPTPQPVLVGHVTWQGRPAQPNALQQLPITLTLKSSTSEVNYPMRTTDQYGFFTITLGTLPSGIYTWRVDDTASGQHLPNYLANTGTLDLTLTGTATPMPIPITQVEMGLMRAGDANNDNLISALDFNLLKVSYGLGCGDPQYDNRADFTGDCVVNISDFNPLKANYGQSGAPPITANDEPPRRQEHQGRKDF